MKKVNRIVPLLMLPLLFAATSCSDDNLGHRKGNGTLKLAVDISQSLDERMSRTISSAERDSLLKKLNIVVSTTDGTPVKYWNGADEIPWSDDVNENASVEFKLAADDYVVEAWSGDSVPASFTKRFYKGTVKATVDPDVTNSIALTCKIANVGVRVSYEEEIDDVLQNYSLTIGHMVDSLKMEGRTDQTAYFMMPKGDKNLVWTFRGKAKDGKDFEKRDTIENAQPGTLYALNFSYTTADSEMGGAFFDVKLIEEDNTKWDAEWTYAIRTTPVVKGFSSWVDTDNPDYWPTLQKMGPAATIGEVNLVVLSSGELTSVKLRYDGFRDLLNGTQIEVLNVKDGDYYFENLKSIYRMRRDSVVDDATMTSYFRMQFGDGFAAGFAEGTREYIVTATDVDRRHYFWPNEYPLDQRTVEATFRLIIGDDKTSVVEATQAQKLMVWDSEVLFKGEISNGTPSAYGFKWWRKNDASKTILGQITGTSSVVSTVFPNETIGGDNSKFFYAIVNKENFPGMEEGVEYEYITYFDGTDASMTTGTFVINNPQIPNSDFENWTTDGKVVVAAKSTNSADWWWDSGNKGSSTLNKTVTNQSSDVRPGSKGSKSAELKSQWVGTLGIGKFAAGNIFLGRFLGTENTYYGILGWGLPFTARPKELKVWVKYTNGTIDYNDDNCPDPELQKGKTDIGIIYVALLDDTNTGKNGTYSGSANYPILVKTKGPQLFDKNDANVIAYGVHEFRESIGWTEITIPIDYYISKKDSAPKYILLTASASKGGDYYDGSTSSVMYLDDLELVY